MLVKIKDYSSTLGFNAELVCDKHSDINFDKNFLEKHIVQHDHIGEIGILLREGRVFTDTTERSTTSYYIVYLQESCIYIIANEKEIEKLTW